MSRAPRIDVVSDAFKRDPFPTLARLQAEGPIVRARIPLIGEVWLVNTHAAVGSVLKDSQHFVVDARNAGRGRFDAFPIPIPTSLQRLANNMLGSDDPDHRRLRNLVERAFRRRNVDGMHERIEALADHLLGRLAPRAASGQPVDLVEEFARRLPMGVISELLGLPESDRPLFERWSKGLASAGSAVGILRALPGLRKLGRYFEQQIEHARREGGEGLIPALVQAEHEGERLTEDELISMIFLLMLAGFETTTNLISGGVLTLLQHPAEREKLFAGGDAAMAPAVEELLRFVTPVQMTKPRYAVQDVEVAGVRVQRGEVLMPFLAAANADPAVFADPATLDLARPSNPHFAFGSGVHSCLGLQLARAEGSVAIAHLFARLPDLRLAVDDAEIRWTKRLGLRALRSLPISAG